LFLTKIEEKEKDMHKVVKFISKNVSNQNIQSEKQCLVSRNIAIVSPVEAFDLFSHFL